MDIEREAAAVAAAARDDAKSSQSYSSQVGALAKLAFRKRTKLLIILLLLTTLSVLLQVHQDLKGGCLKWERNVTESKTKTMINTMGKMAKGILRTAAGMTSDPSGELRIPHARPVLLNASDLRLAEVGHPEIGRAVPASSA